MNLDLEELRAQRELVLRHLRWLESKIANLEPSEDAAQESDGPPSPPLPHKPPATPQAPVARAAPAVQESAGKPVPDPSIPGVGTLRAQSASDIKRARFGCLFLFVAACGLFLFLLFGLPYLID